MMVVRGTDLFRELETIRERMSRLLEEDVGSRAPRGEAPRAGTWTPAVDIYETDEAVVIKAELPGVAGDGIGVEVRDGVLTLSGERRVEQRAGGERYHRVERRYGTFRRAFGLARGVDPDKVEASLRDGVLEVRLPKEAEARAQQVEVRIS